MGFFDGALNIPDSPFGKSSSPFGKSSSPFGKSSSPFGKTFTSSITNLFGNSTVGSLGKIGVGFSTGDVGSIFSGLTSIVGGIFGGKGNAREKKYALDNIKEARNSSNIASGSLTAINEYDRILNKKIGDHTKLYKHLTSATILRSELAKLKSQLQSSGYTVSGIKTATGTNARGSFSYTHTIYNAPNKAKVTNQTKSVVSGLDSIVSKPSTINTILLVVGAYFGYKIFIKK